MIIFGKHFNKINEKINDDLYSVKDSKINKLQLF